LLPAALVFLLLLLNDKPLMGAHVNTLWENIMNWSIVFLVVVMSSLLGISTIFPDFFK
jgi:Mn2+/Fe2+ NRAMP family transporter